MKDRIGRVMGWFGFLNETKGDFVVMVISMVGCVLLLPVWIILGLIALVSRGSKWLAENVF
jgi:hypothetical protein